MLKKIFPITLVTLFCIKLSAQVVTTTPSIPTSGDAVTVYFNATLGTKGLMGYTGDIYAHTGVITDKSTSSSDWKYVKAGWTENIPACKLTSLGNDKYKLEISPNIRTYYGVPADEKILKMAFVFRSANSQNEGKGTGNSDIFVDIYESSLTVNISTPEGKYIIVNKGDIINIKVNALKNDSIVLYNNNTRLTSVMSNSLNYFITTTGNNDYSLIAKAFGGGKIVSDTLTLIMKGDIVQEPVPAGCKDGINYPDNNTVTFVLFAPYKEYVYLIGDFNNWIPNSSYLMKKDGDRFWFTLHGLTSGKEYLFQYLIDGTIRIADPYAEKISDPANDKYIPNTTYPNLIKYPTDKTSEIAGVVQPGQATYNWQYTDYKVAEKSQLVIYEMLIRDFTADKSINGAKEKIQYLKTMGINAIELMPFNEFEGNDSWGYNPSFYFATDKAYGTKNDYKAFIDECHQNSIAVIMDMVLNHSYGQSPFARMYLENGKPSAQNPWYNVNSNMLNPSAQWGFDFNHESPYTQKLVDSVCSYWMSEYKIDGFRFDFTKGFTNTPYGVDSWASEYDASRIKILKRMTSEIWKRKPNAYVIFEHLAVNNEEKELADYGIMLWGNMNHAYTQMAMGYTSESDFSWISYKERNWQYPNVVGYMESHDEERMAYKCEIWGNSSASYNIANPNTYSQRIAMNFLFFLPIPGPKMIWQFGELGYNESINLNGRLGSKPLHWEYFDDPYRKGIYDMVQTLTYLKASDSLYTSGDITINASGYLKTINLSNSVSNAIIVGNFDVTKQNVVITFPKTGWWYDVLEKDSIEVTSSTLQLDYNPGEFHLYSTKKYNNDSIVVTAIKNKQINSSKLAYPNPFNNYIYLKNKDKFTVEIYNIQGQKVYQNANSPSVINTENLNNGIYFLKIKNKFNSLTTNMIKVGK